MSNYEMIDLFINAAMLLLLLLTFIFNTIFAILSFIQNKKK